MKTITVVAHPNSKNPRIENDLLGVLHVYVHEPALEGKANRAVIDALAAHFHVKRSAVFFLRGETSKQKVFAIEE